MTDYVGIRFSLKPMMSDREVEIIDGLIEQRKPKACLEWGSGGSTVYFPSEHDCIESWDVIEHNGHYMNFLAPHLHEKVKFHWIQENKNEYISFFNDSVFDFILIDGLYRDECLKIARHMIGSGGFILLHDSGRAEYREWIRSFDGKITKLIDGEIPTRDGFVHRGLTLFELEA